MTSSDRTTAEAPLHGLVLAGGESRRMGRPKWAIDYVGETQLQRSVRLLRNACERVFVSARRGQAIDVPADVDVIEDQIDARGPIAGILSAMELHPKAAWLVLACDLPFLDEGTLSTLIERRNQHKIATAYRSANDGLPEPLCAIWEPQARERLLEAISADLQCPRKVLIRSRPELIALGNPVALENANTPEDYEAVKTALASNTGA